MNPILDPYRQWLDRFCQKHPNNPELLLYGPVAIVGAFFIVLIALDKW